MRVLIGTAIAAAAFATILVLYATGPSRKASRLECTPSANNASAFCITSGRHAYVAVRTNAWERFKGAITGDP